MFLEQGTKDLVGSAQITLKTQSLDGAMIYDVLAFFVLFEKLGNERGHG